MKTKIPGVANRELISENHEENANNAHIPAVGRCPYVFIKKQIERFIYLFLKYISSENSTRGYYNTNPRIFKFVQEHCHHVASVSHLRTEFLFLISIFLPNP